MNSPQTNCENWKHLDLEEDNDVDLLNHGGFPRYKALNLTWSRYNFEQMSKNTGFLSLKIVYSNIAVLGGVSIQVILLLFYLAI